MADRGDMGSDLWLYRYKVATTPENWYSRKLFEQEWNVKLCRGRQRKCWCKIVNELLPLIR